MEAQPFLKEGHHRLGWLAGLACLPKQLFPALVASSGWAELPSSRPRLLWYRYSVHTYTINQVILCALALPVDYCVAPRGGTPRGGLPVCPILASRVSVQPLYRYLSLYSRVGPTLLPHHACAPFHRSRSVKSDQPSPSINASTTPASATRSRPTSVLSLPSTAPFSSVLTSRPPLQTHGRALARGARQDARLAATR